MKSECNYLCIVSPKNKSAWMMRDEQIFKNIGFNIKNSLFSLDKGVLISLQFIKQFFHLIHIRSKCKVIICQGAGYHSVIPAFLSRVLGFKLVIVAIGTDCVSYPTLNYGNYRKKLYGFATKYSFKRATKICPVHSSLVYYENTFYPQDFKKQGLKSFVPALKSSQVTVINNGFDSLKWVDKNIRRQEQSFLTVVGEINNQTYYLKGIDLILEFAKNRPQSKITIVGNHALNIEKLENVTYVPFVHQSELLRIYNTHEYYLQLSVSEGLPNSLCEAMLCGCIPVVSSNSSMPEIVGKNKNVVRKKSLSSLINTLQYLNNNTEKSYFRKRIINNYPLEKRQNQFEKLLREL